MMPAHPPQLLTMELVLHRANARYDIECLYFFHEDHIILTLQNVGGTASGSCAEGKSLSSQLTLLDPQF